MSHPYHGMLALVLLGLIAQLPTIAAPIIEYGDAGSNDNGTSSKNPFNSNAKHRPSPGQLLQTIRNHWQVENNLHGMKDRYGDEDRHYLKWAGKVFVCLTNLALSLLNGMRWEEDSIKETAENVPYEPEKILLTLE